MSDEVLTGRAVTQLVDSGQNAGLEFQERYSHDFV